MLDMRAIDERREVVDTLSSFRTHSCSVSSGNTTRLVDHAMQLLFQGYRVVVRDHEEGGNSSVLNEQLYRLILRRLHAEHTYYLLERKVITHRTQSDIILEILD